MPSLRISLPGQGPATYRLYKPITTLGEGPENDVVLHAPGVAATHAHIHFDGSGYHIAELERDAEIYVNGKRRKRHRLEHGDQVRIGSAEVLFRLREDPREAQDGDGAGVRGPAAGPGAAARAGAAGGLAGVAPAGSGESALQRTTEIGAYRKLYEFSEKLLGQYALGDLLESLMDHCVNITRADKGFLILAEGDDFTVKVARNLHRENITDAKMHLSDSIVAKVIAQRSPVIVSDAINDNDVEFSGSRSVMDLKLCSVMCVPLSERGNLLGVIYVGNDRVIDLFTPQTLEVLVIFAAQASLILRNALLVNELKLDNRVLTEKLEAMRFGEIIGACPQMQEVFKKVRKIASTDISVLITGESGTGKELIAREIHDRSARAKGPFIAINCGAIPENLLESELFGHVRGAFTGATATRPGKFQAASTGTLFLDEIGEMPVNLQVKILRALQEKMVQRVGESRPEPVDIRIIAATNKRLEEEIRGGRFREDLYYRLNVVNLHLPPLRERGDDILVIAKYLLSKFAQEYSSRVKGFTPNAAIALKKYPWPGNIRQLENHIKKAVVLADKVLIGPEDMDLTAAELPPIVPLAQAKEDFQRRYINEVLLRNNGNRTKTARDLGVDPRTIFRHLEKEGDEDGLGEQVE
jgi:transcriptional regulator with GAF, ATPase, and Fis domain